MCGGPFWPPRYGTSNCQSRLDIGFRWSTTNAGNLAIRRTEPGRRSCAVGLKTDRQAGPFVSMVQSAELSDCHHSSHLWPLNRPRIGCILAQPKMSAAPVIIGEIRGYVSAQRFFGEDNHVVQALPRDGTDHTLHVGSLPGRPRRGQHFLDLHILDLSAEVVIEDLVAIAQQISWNSIERKRLAQFVGPSIPPSDGRSR